MAEASPLLQQPRTPVEPALAAAAAPKSACQRAAKAGVRATYVLLAVSAAATVWQLVATHAERHVVVWAVAGLACGVAVPLSLYDLNSHVQNFVSPLQAHYMRILLMVPVFCTQAFLALVFREQRVWLEALRQCYEALVYSLFHLLLAFVGSERAVVAALAARGERRAALLPPLCCVPGCRVDLDGGGSFLVWVRRGVLQYVVLQNVCALVNLGAGLGGVFCAWAWGEFRHCVFPWTAALLMASQACAMFSLLSFYKELRRELAPLRPLPKLLCVKFVVFFSFWQGNALSLLGHLGAIAATDTFTLPEVISGVQNLTVCVEMAVAAVLHHSFFSRGDFKGALGELMPRFSGGGGGGAPALAALLHVRDVLREARSLGAAARDYSAETPRA